jgi:hypothetical protein
MLKKSMLDISNPEFNRIIMKKVMLEDKRRFIIKNITLYFLVFVTICVAIIIIIRSVFTAPGFPGWRGIISGNIAQEVVWLMQNIHFFIPFFILILLKRILKPPRPIC